MSFEVPTKALAQSPRWAGGGRCATVSNMGVRAGYILELPYTGRGVRSATQQPGILRGRRNARRMDGIVRLGQRSRKAATCRTSRRITLSTRRGVDRGIVIHA